MLLYTIVDDITNLTENDRKSVAIAVGATTSLLLILGTRCEYVIRRPTEIDFAIANCVSVYVF